MDDRTKQALGLLVVAAIGGLVTLVLTVGGVDRDSSPAGYLLLLAGWFTLVVCAAVGLVRLAIGLLRSSN